tara:strand:+ start:2878 stop:3270 length:393 start_codon:yes stop_codon:yes gene_type:complete
VIFGLLKWAVIGGVVLTAWHALARPEWVDDVLLRAFSADHVSQSAAQDPNFEEASRVASEVGLPVAWVLALMKAGVKLADIEPAAKDLITTMKQMGVPVDMLPATLVAYRDKVMSAVVAGYTSAKNTKGG